MKVNVWVEWGESECWIATSEEPIDLPLILPNMDIGFPSKDEYGRDIGASFVRLKKFVYDITGASLPRINVEGSVTACENIVRAGGWTLLNSHPEFGHGKLA